MLQSDRNKRVVVFESLEIKVRVLMRELECNRALLTMTLISGADVSMPAFELQEDSFNIHRGMN